MEKTELILKAEEFAREAHKGQVRKMDNSPYIVHPLEVEEILMTLTDDENVIAAGLLHDTLEDCGIDPNVLTEEFGITVSALVQAESEDRSSNKSQEETWMERKAESLIFLENTKDLRVKMMWLADKLSNMRSFYRNHLRLKEDMWSHFHQHDPKMHYWYYSTIATYTSELKETKAYKEYCELVDKTFKQYLE